MLHEPDDGDWLLWRRTYNAFGYSPLSQINTDNVDELRVAWTWSLAPGKNEFTPLVHEGSCSCTATATTCKHSMP